MTTAFVVETVIRADRASSIDTQKPVSVEMAGHSEPVNDQWRS
ncbi:hypothetical protein [Coleofasciculus sp. FACHB-1120]|nr:hypothetical protein [Coleofasciculus sp. FACHB-1120]